MCTMVPLLAETSKTGRPALSSRRGITRPDLLPNLPGGMGSIERRSSRQAQISSPHLDFWGTLHKTCGRLTHGSHTTGLLSTITMTEVDPKRSANMARIGPRNTAPELAVRKLLHRMGYRFRIHRRDLPGTPDVVLPGLRTIFLIHGCFWHRHAGCRLAYTPKSRVDFWLKKFAANVARDQEVCARLEQDGWRVCVVWECETREIQQLTQRLRRVLRQQEQGR
jgi:DNA mismatch endonuclease (patch repair protein)